MAALSCDLGVIRDTLIPVFENFILLFLDFWYRLVYDEGNYQIADHCLEMGSCGTLAPIWMQGNHPTEGTYFLHKNNFAKVQTKV